MNGLLRSALAHRLALRRYRIADDGASVIPELAYEDTATRKGNMLPKPMRLKDFFLSEMGQPDSGTPGNARGRRGRARPLAGCGCG